jgi:hypothetical protein
VCYFINRERRNFGKPIKRQKMISLPYLPDENLAMIYRSVHGPNRENTGKVKDLPMDFVLNDIKPEYTLSFIGDILGLNGKKIIIDLELKRFLKGSDFIIGNFESILTNSINRKRTVFELIHTPQILTALESLITPDKMYLSIANNHAADFGKDTFLKSIEILNHKGFNVFGTKETPFVDLNGDIRVIAGSMWSNKQCDYITNFYDSHKFLIKDAFNIFFPHWGWEVLLYPSPNLISLIRYEQLLDKFDAIVGHHSHCPQPIEFRKSSVGKKLIAYCLGDFCFGNFLTHTQFNNFRYGIILRVEIGRNSDGLLQIGRVKKRFIISNLKSDNDVFIQLANKINI